MSTQARRDELVHLLRRRDNASVRSLARELGASERTVIRDIAHLRSRGFDIVGLTGPGGGVWLDPRSVMVTSRLDASDVVALALSVAIAQASPWLPFAGTAPAALDKIVEALPSERKDELQAAMSLIYVAEPSPPGAWPLGAVDPDLVAVVEAAVTGRRAFAFDFVSESGQRTSRIGEVLGLVVRAPLWHVVAWDVDKNAGRIFRADRIRNPNLTEQPSQRRGIRVEGVCPDALPAVAPSS